MNDRDRIESIVKQWNDLTIDQAYRKILEFEKNAEEIRFTILALYVVIDRKRTGQNK